MAPLDPMIFHRFQFNQFDPDALKGVIDGSELQHTFLSPDTCTANVEKMISTNFSCEAGYYSFPVLVRGRFAPGRICVGTAFGSQHPTWVNGILLDRPSIEIYPEGTELLYRAGESADWLAFSISREDLQKAALKRVGAEIPLPSTGLKSIEISSQQQLSLFRALRSAPRRADYEPDQQLLNMVIDLVARADPRLENHLLKRQRNRFELIARADRVFRESIGKKYSSSHFCRTIGSSERSLQSHFQDAFGMTPKAWFSLLSLNEARNRLLHLPNRPGAVADVAMECGFEHLGRFSESYRKLFNELPSETLRKV